MAVNYVLPVEMVHFDSFSLHAINYQPIDAVGLDGACSILRLVNASDASIFISLDGTTDHDFLKAGEDMTLNFQLMHQPNGNVSKIKRLAKVYVRGGPPKFGGYIYLMGYYNP